MSQISEYGEGFVTFINKGVWLYHRCKFVGFVIVIHLITYVNKEEKRLGTDAP